MKLATYKNGSRDGASLVVSRDLRQCVVVASIAANLQRALDDWEAPAPRLEQVYAALDAGTLAEARTFDERLCHSPLPRAYQWADGSAYLNHVELVRKARKAEMPASFYSDPPDELEPHWRDTKLHLPLVVSRVRIDMFDPRGASIFGAIEQGVEPA